jgi:hypothetical protein
LIRSMSSSAFTRTAEPLSHLREQLERFFGFLEVQAFEGETGVYQDPFPHLRVLKKGQIGLQDIPGQRDLGTAAVDFRNLSGHC